MIRKRGPIPEVFSAKSYVMDSKNDFDTSVKNANSTEKNYSQLDQNETSTQTIHTTSQMEKTTKSNSSQNPSLGFAAACFLMMSMLDFNK
jgi:hypothetical protein